MKKGSAMPAEATGEKLHTKRKKMTRAMLAGFVCVVLVFLALFVRNYIRKTAYRADMKRLTSEAYDGIYLSMSGERSFLEEDLAYYMAETIVGCSYTPVSFQEIERYLNAISRSENTLKKLYLDVDPDALWEKCGKKEKNWNQGMSKICDFLDANPNLQAVVYFPAHSLEYWASVTDEERDIFYTVCRNFLDAMSTYPNARVVFFGNREWMIGNPDCYGEEGSLTEEAAREMWIVSVADTKYDLTQVNFEASMQGLENLIRESTETEVSISNLESWDIVYFGDSVIGNYEDCFSIPGVVSGLTGAEGYNLAVGGSSASILKEGDDSFLHRIAYFQGNEVSILGRAAEGCEQLVFVINYGLNDYFSGVEIENNADGYDDETYAGALRIGIETLQNTYPDAIILLASPNYITSFERGTEIVGEGGWVLTDYVAMAKKIAEEKRIYFFNTYENLGTDGDDADDYLVDMVHPNEQGRFLFGEKIAEVLSAMK